jgi:chromosome segregation protein
MRFHGTGISAIVGPNGCGKSNLSDAISWVLGEQSAKSLRGIRMEDVIFAGTRDRKALSMAQVTMTLVDPNVEPVSEPVVIHATEHDGANGASGMNGHANGHANGTIHAAAGPGGGARPRRLQEVTITRRLYRNGDSEYLIDGKSARLRDIQDIFMGTGLGPESYAIIEQGRIGQLLSSKPHDRRAVIEEAAGIGKFKTKRRFAEAKLESAKQNLARVFDILEEVGRQANSLKRQAGKAKRYVELRKELVVQLRVALTGKYKMLEREATRIAIELNQATGQFQALTAKVAERETEQTRVLEQGYAVEGELTAAREQLAQHRLEGERTRGRIEAQVREIANMEARFRQGESDTSQITQRHEQISRELEEHASRLAGLEEESTGARERLDEKTRERDSAQAELREHEQQIENGRQAVLRLFGEVSNLRNQLGQMEGYFQSVERDRGRLSREEQMAQADLERLEARKAVVSQSLAARQLELQSLGDQKKVVEEEASARKTAAAQTRRDLETARAEASRLQARKDSLEEILSHRAYTTDSVKRLFTAFERGEAHELEPSGVLADFVEVDPQWEKAAEEFLHEELEYVLVRDWSQADAGIDLMWTDIDGRATFLIHPNPGDAMSSAPDAQPALGPETGIVARLSDVLRLTNGLTQAPAALIPRLARCFIAESRQSAQRLAMQYPDFYFLCADGVCYHGHAVSGGRKIGSGPLGLKRELRDLIGVVSNRQKELEANQAKLHDLEDEIRHLTEEMETLRTKHQGREREALALEHEDRRLAEEFGRANSKLSVARLELQRLDRDVKQAEQRRDEAQRAVAEKDAIRLRQEEGLAGYRLSLGDLQRRAAHLAEEHSALRIQMAEREERRRAERSAMERVQQQAHDLLRRRDAISAEMQRLALERERLIGDNARLDEAAAVVGRAIEVTEAEVARLARQEQELREMLAAIDEQLKAMRQEAQAAQERRGQVELQLVERRAELKFLDETSQNELKASIAELASQDESEIDEVALLEAEEKVQGLKTRIENLGPVNPDALQEYEEAQQRYDFLNTQRQDLLDSIRDTEKAIQEIDVESKRRFNDAFEAINRSFKEMFTRLFGGGMAEMRLTDESNVNDSGIDIVASPPGKRLQNVLLLSGGEKALTAIALLMAVFRYTPSPFCMLDEVDAPLDEPNIQRLMGLLEDMAGTTQFIIITHAKRTMESAESLYGVTMQEPGVSRLVSVRFDHSAVGGQRAPAMASARA